MLFVLCSAAYFLLFGTFMHTWNQALLGGHILSMSVQGQQSLTIFIFEIFVKWEPGSTVTRTRIYTYNKYETFSRTDMVVSCWSTGSRALQKYTPQPHTVTNSLCQSDPEWRTMTWAKPSQSPGCDGVAKATKQLTIKKGLGVLCIWFIFSTRKVVGLGLKTPTSNLCGESHPGWNCVTGLFRALARKMWTNETDRQTRPDRPASQPARQTHKHTHRNTHAHTPGLKSTFLPFEVFW